MTESAVAGRYARALFELAVEQNATAGLADKLRDLARLHHQSRDLKNVLENPRVDHEHRDAVLKEIAGRLGLTGMGLNAVRLMGSRRRLDALPEVARIVEQLADQASGVLRASVTTAARMPDDFYQKLGSELSAATQQKVVLQRHEDPSLIAGVVTRIGDNTIDGSLAGRLFELERQMMGA